MKVLFLSNIPSPYRLDFFSELGKYIDLKVIFEAERNYDLNENWYKEKFDNFDYTFLKKGAIEERKINWKILNYINKKNQDLIIVTNYAYFTELIGLLYIKFKKIPYCMEIDGGIIKRENILLRKLKGFLIKGAKAYISPSRATDKFLIHYGADKDRIYRYPFTSLKKGDLLNENIASDEKEDIKNEMNIKEKNVILGVGRFIDIKGFDILLKAAKDIVGDVGIYIVGGKPTEEYLKLKEELGLKNVYFIDFKQKNNLSKYYKAADIFVLPTRGDVWGLVINEAMSYGLPVITTNKCVAGLELISNNDNGFIVEVDNIEELSQRINSILQDREMMKKMSKNNLEKIKRYTIENMAEENLRILREIRG